MCVMAADAVAAALQELKNANDVLDFHSQIKELDAQETEDSDNAIRDLKTSFENLPAITINIAKKKIPNVLIQREYMRADRYSNTGTTLTPILDDAEFRIDCTATVRKLPSERIQST